MGGMCSPAQAQAEPASDHIAKNVLKTIRKRKKHVLGGPGGALVERVGLGREEGQGRGGVGDRAYYGYRGRKWTRKQSENRPENVKQTLGSKRTKNVLHQYVKKTSP